MPQKIITATFALGFLVTGSIALAFVPLPVTFPIVELGGCTSKDSCKAYCDDLAHQGACFAYAQTHGLMSAQEISLAKKLQSQVGPGGCEGVQCKIFCKDSAHAQICVAFAQQHGFISPSDAAARQQRINATGTRLQILKESLPIKSPSPPHPTEGSSTGQSGSVFFAILHFFRL